MSLAFPASPVAGQDACRFPDVPDTDAAHADITYACRQGWFSGYPDGSFRPDRPVPAHQLATVVGRAFAAGSTRADMATFLRGGAPGDPASPAGFADVPATHPQSEDIAYAVERSWFQGYPDDTFRPDRTITARQITTVLTRAFPTGSTRADLAAFMRNSQQALTAKTKPQPSPSTSKIAYEVPVYDSLGDKVAKELWVASSDGSGARRLTDDVSYYHYEDYESIGDWAWSPGGERIAYEVTVRDFRGNKMDSELWVADADGLGARKLSDDDYRGWRWSPDGERVAYEVGSERDSWGNIVGSELWVVDADGSGVRRLPGNIRRWGWSPDGERIVYEVKENSQNVETVSELWVVGVDGPGARRLTHEEVSNRGWEWSPDRERISFTVQKPDSQGYEVPRELWVASVDGFVTRRLTDDVGITNFINKMWWSPDGERIVYEVKENSQDEEAVSELWVVGINGSEPFRLTEDFAYNWEFLPSGERIAYQSRVWEFGRWLGYGLWLTAADGSGAQQIADDVEDWQWSPEGERIAYEVKARDSRRTVLGSVLWVAGPDASGARRLTDDVVIGDWLWSPEGERIFYDVDVRDSSGSRRELWVVDVDGSDARRLAEDVAVSERGSGSWYWSTDRERIFYDVDVRDSSGGRRELWVVDSDGSGTHRLTDDVALYEWGSSRLLLSPDGENLAYAVNVWDSRGNETATELWVAEADGSGARKIADNFDNWRWQPEEG